jgi:predicted nucleotidyltransferase
VFTPGTRQRLREALVAAASADDRIIGAALTGSATVGREDRWSDVDLALSVAEGIDRGQAITDWAPCES